MPSAAFAGGLPNSYSSLALLPPADPRPSESLEPLSHLEERAGRTSARMVDVGDKPVTARRAVARARVVFPPHVRARALAGAGPKGAIEEVARVAGILAAKRTGELIPMCHPLGLDHVEVAFAESGEEALDVHCSVACQGRTGVEMEAMVGAAIAALCVYDMAKGIDKGIRVESVELVEKSGGKSGTWRADPR